MPTCFVIQPFDAGKFDKLYEQVFRTAIIAAGLDPYRVDQDHSVDVPINGIEAGIRNALVCLADITTDNPNVWYELGYAYAAGTPVVMVCSNERIKYPFDIQHRTIISYTTDAPNDFKQLQAKITARLEDAKKKGEVLRQIAESDSVAPVAGLSQNELTLVAALADKVGTPDGTAPVWDVQKTTERAGLTMIGFNLALHGLIAKSFVQQMTQTDYNDNDYAVLKVSDKGWGWIHANDSLFVLHRPSARTYAQAAEGYADLTDDDIPF